MINFIHEGGPIVLIIAFASLFGLFLLFERLIYVAYIRRKTGSIVENLKKLLRQKRIGQIRQMCKNSSDPVSNITMKLIDSKRESGYLGGDTLTLLIENEMIRIQRNYKLISMIITISPLLGLLGTVTGMIKIFNSIAPSQSGGIAYKAELAAGISEALYTTVAGLVVAITLSILMSFLWELTDKLEATITEGVNDVANFLRELSDEEVR
ncbi:MAG: biopolymer transport protein ExbB [Thermotogaceae bacterium]|jgi:biopolymer transport protein ExbB|nr:biopolymer transport protein ExbB [Thermotogaceae bacterium]MDN5337327.1 biopolymer transport protein ExbB [Thermotogaceae bacterium]